MFVVVSYDVVDDKKRARLARLLLDYGRRVQKSVFECLVDEKQFLEMKFRVERGVDLAADSVRYYILCQRCVNAVQISGWGTVSEDESDAVFLV